MQKVERSGGEWVSLLKCQLFAWSKRWVDKFQYASGWWDSLHHADGWVSLLHADRWVSLHHVDRWVSLHHADRWVSLHHADRWVSWLHAGGWVSLLHAGGWVSLLHAGGWVSLLHAGGWASLHHAATWWVNFHHATGCWVIRRIVGQVQRYKYVIQYFTLTKTTYQNNCIKLYFLNPPDRSLSNHSRIPHTWRYLGSPRRSKFQN